MINETADAERQGGGFLLGLESDFRLVPPVPVLPASHATFLTADAMTMAMTLALLSLP